MKEEKAVRRWGIGQTSYGLRKMFFKDVTALVKAIREDCAKKADRHSCDVNMFDECYCKDEIAKEIRGKKK